jgi:DNA-binding NarL/FixJ family response regulator
MFAIVIFCADPALRHKVESWLREDSSMIVVGVTDDPSAVLPLIDQNHVDAVLADAPPHAQLADWRTRHGETAFLVLVGGGDNEDGLDALYAGSQAILCRTAGRNQIVVAIKALIAGLAVLPPELLATLLHADSLVHGFADRNDAGDALLTPRELEVLVAMADGASNKAIARRLGISFHTAKFHVAAILAKMDADSRTEAVTKAAQLGLVML